MHKMRKKHTGLFIFLLLLIAFGLFEVKKISNELHQKTAEPIVAIPNPASEYCAKQGGFTHTEKKEEGGEYTLCTFDDNRSCEEWAMFRGDCPIGGRKTTGFDTIEQKYCAWVGGETTTQEDAMCLFKDGVSCSLTSVYTHTCKK